MPSVNCLVYNYILLWFITQKFFLFFLLSFFFFFVLLNQPNVLLISLPPVIVPIFFLSGQMSNKCARNDFLLFSPQYCEGWRYSETAGRKKKKKIRWLLFWDDITFYLFLCFSVKINNNEMVDFGHSYYETGHF